MKSVLIEKRELEGGEYGFKVTEAIIEGPKGKMFICSGFGGMGELRGGAVRWEHGHAIKLRSSDTFAVLDKDDTLYNARHGYGEDREIMQWDGFYLEKIARRLGL